MWEAWWNAHQLELVGAGIILAPVGIIVACEFVAEVWREWRRKKRSGVL